MFDEVDRHVRGNQDLIDDVDDAIVGRDIRFGKVREGNVVDLFQLLVDGDVSGGVLELQAAPVKDLVRGEGILGNQVPFKNLPKMNEELGLRGILVPEVHV